ncbi:MAG: NHLP-related RiPP peptide [Xanthomonadales bacterium]|nr:NHLP-related RiPP peptide [Xanthomonadales bacterium]
MADTKLSNEQAVALLRKLGSDDTFRALFESKPALALHKAGIPAETIVGLDAKCLCPRELADKSLFGDAAEKLDQVIIAETMTMEPPRLRLRR